MKGRRIARALLLCAVMGAYFLRLYARPAASTVPLTQVFAYAAPTQAPAAQSYRERRDAQRAQEMTALEKISQENFEAGEELMRLIERQEKELAIESALAARCEGAVCLLVRYYVLSCSEGSQYPVNHPKFQRSNSFVFQFQMPFCRYHLFFQYS